MVLESFSTLSNSMILRFCSHFSCSLPLKSLKRKGRNFMTCSFNRNNREFQILSVQSTKPVWMMKNFACFLLRGMSLFTLWMKWLGSRGCWIFSALGWGFVVCFCGAACHPPLLHPEPPAAPPVMECRNCSGELPWKGLTCLLLSSVAYKYLC